MSTNTNTTNTASIPASSSNAPPAPSYAPTFNGWAGALWSELLKLTGLSVKELEDWLTTQKNDIGMQFDEGINSGAAQYEEAIKNADQTKLDGITALVSGATVIGTSSLGLAYDNYGENGKLTTSTQKNLDRLKKDNNDFFLRPRDPDLGAGDLNQGRRVDNETTRIKELTENGPEAFSTTQVSKDNNPFEQQLQGEELAAFDRQLYAKLDANERAAVKANLDKAIAAKQTELNTYQNTRNNNVAFRTSLNQIAQSVAPGTVAIQKMDDQTDAGYQRQLGTVAGMEQQIASQVGSTLKSMMDKASDGIGSAVQQFQAAITTSLRG